MLLHEGENARKSVLQESPPALARSEDDDTEAIRSNRLSVAYKVLGDTIRSNSIKTEVNTDIDTDILLFQIDTRQELQKEQLTTRAYPQQQQQQLQL